MVVVETPTCLLQNGKISFLNFLEDSNGFVWAGTPDGLSRFEEEAIPLLFERKEGDPNSLPHNYITELFEDKHQQLWVGTSRGFLVFSH